MSQMVGGLAISLFVTLLVAGAVPVDAATRVQLGGVRLPFVENQGQVDAPVAYYAPTFAGTLFVTRQGQLVYGLPGGWSLTETLVAGRPRPAAAHRSATGATYFVGNDPERWRSDLPTYEQVSLGEVWPGVTVALHARGRSVEKVFTLAPGVSVDGIRLRVGGATALSVDPAGRLVARTGRGDVRFTTPVAYQERGGVRHPVTVGYRPQGSEYGFVAGSYDPALPLVIDPLLQSTYLGGLSDDSGRGVAIHPMTGDVYVAGTTFSTNFPGTAGGAQPAANANGHAFVARLNAALTTLIQATYLAGSAFEEGSAVAIHPTTGNVYVAGTTFSTDFPGTAGGAQPTSGGHIDIFVARLNAALTTLVQSTYLGGSNDDSVLTFPSLAIHPTSGEIYVASATFSTNFPGTAGGAQPAHSGTSDAVIARLNSTLTALLNATYYGGNLSAGATGIAIHPTSGEVYVAGATGSSVLPGTAGGAQPVYADGLQDGFVARWNATLSSLLQATYLGGTEFDVASALAIHPTSGDVYVTGSTGSTNFPATAGGAFPNARNDDDQLFGSFVVRLAQSLTAFLQATYLGGGGGSLAIHPVTGDIYVTGNTRSFDLPGTSGGVQPTKPSEGHLFSVFLSRLPRSLTALAQATYLGGSGDEIARGLTLHPLTGDVYVAGSTSSRDFPGTAGGAQSTNGGQIDAFLARLTSGLRAVDLSPGPDLTITKSHVGNFSRGQVAATYTIVVTNVGTAASIGTVTVTDTLPAALTATALAGPGWACVLGTPTCTRNDPLANGSNYPPITLTVNVAANAPAVVINRVTVSGGGDVNPDNDTADDLTSTVNQTFSDVPIGHPFFAWIDALARAGFTGGCRPGAYCPDAGTTRAAIAVFLVRGIHGAAFDPPAPTGTLFADVPITYPLAKWIEQLAHDGSTGGCGPGRYCPDAVATRAEVAVLILRAIHGAAFDPPPATGTMFTDVPITHPFAEWIEQLAREGITGGCGPTTFCPDDPVTRGQIAVLLVRAFNLPM